MSYFRASTENPNGWRPGIQRLGYLSSGRHRGPDWKAVAAQHDAALRLQQQHRGAVQRRSAIRTAQVDAYARGDRTPVLYRGLSGLGYTPIDLAGDLVQGAQYTFHFRVTGTVLGGVGSINPTDIAQAVATDSNFGSPSANTVPPDGFSVTFTYVGLGSKVVGAASEMQSVINSHAFNGLGFLAKAAFIVAEGGPPGQAAAGQISQQVTTPGDQAKQQQDQQPSSVPSWVWWAGGSLVFAKVIGIF